jgi:hypothetical protein
MGRCCSGGRDTAAGYDSSDNVFPCSFVPPPAFVCTSLVLVHTLCTLLTPACTPTCLFVPPPTLVCNPHAHSYPPHSLHACPHLFVPPYSYPHKCSSPWACLYPPLGVPLFVLAWTRLVCIHVDLCRPHLFMLMCAHTCLCMLGWACSCSRGLGTSVHDHWFSGSMVYNLLVSLSVLTFA